MNSKQHVFGKATCAYLNPDLGKTALLLNVIDSLQMANETAAMLVGNNVELASPSSSEGTESSGGESSSSGEVSSRAEQTDVHQLAYNKYERVTIPLY